jgi:DNA-binding response OmpR family regulator
VNHTNTWRIRRVPESIPSSTPEQPIPPGHRRSLRIVLADDDRDTVLTLSALLRGEGHDVRGVHNGSEVLAMVRDFDADVLILDIAMPGLSGYDVAKRIKETRGNEKRPWLIGISGVYKQGADIVLARIVGFDKFLGKPCAFDLLLAAIQAGVQEFAPPPVQG